MKNIKQGIGLGIFILVVVLNVIGCTNKDGYTEVIVPREFFEGENKLNIDELDSGIERIEVSDDGSVSIKVTTEKQEEVKRKMEENKDEIL